MFNNFTIFTVIKKNLQGQFDALDQSHEKLLVSIQACLLHVCFIFVFYFLGVVELFYFNFLSVALWCWTAIESLASNYFRASIIGTIEILAHAIYATSLLGLDTGFQLYLWPLLAWLAFTFSNKRLHGVLISLFCMSCLLGVYIFEHHLLTIPTYRFSEATTIYLYISNLFFACCLMVFTAFFIRRGIEIQKNQLRALATRDQLTNLFNRRYFLEFIQKYRQKSIRDKEPFCVVMADIDHFKSINDTYGHSTGDNVLKLVADYLQKGLRSNDIIARWGGEEFLFVLVNCEKQEAARRIEQLRLGFSQNILVEGNNNEVRSVTMSFGVVQSDNDKTIDELISRADQLLFDAKRTGRNKVVTDAILELQT
jgi:diguanylate cyclase (GGDEF)-like protein